MCTERAERPIPNMIAVAVKLYVVLARKDVLKGLHHLGVVRRVVGRYTPDLGYFSTGREAG